MEENSHPAVKSRVMLPPFQAKMTPPATSTPTKNPSRRPAVRSAASGPARAHRAQWSTLPPSRPLNGSRLKRASTRLMPANRAPPGRKCPSQARARLTPGPGQGAQRLPGVGQRTAQLHLRSRDSQPHAPHLAAHGLDGQPVAPLMQPAGDDSRRDQPLGIRVVEPGQQQQKAAADLYPTQTHSVGKEGDVVGRVHVHPRCI